MFILASSPTNVPIHQQNTAENAADWVLAIKQALMPVKPQSLSKLISNSFAEKNNNDQSISNMAQLKITGNFYFFLF